MGKLKLATLGALIAAVLVVTAIFIQGGAMHALQDISVLERSWDDYAKHELHKSTHLNEMRSALGYGGLIHHFKNYVLRKDPERLEKARKAIADFRRTVAEHREHGLSDEEEKDVQAIERTVAQYERNLTRVEEMAKSGASIEELDRAVKVDDGPALRALMNLHNQAVRSREIKIAEELVAEWSGIVGIRARDG